MPTHYDVEVSAISAKTCDAVNEAATRLCVPAAGLLQSVIAQLQESALSATALDGRAAWWQVRCRLYAASDGYRDALADSDPDLAPSDLGATRLQSLPEVAKWMRDLARAYHGGECAGMDEATLKRRLRSLRNQMSVRHDGTGILRLEYSVIPQIGRSLIARAPAEVMHMMARCDLVRSDGASVPRRMPGIARSGVK